MHSKEIFHFDYYCFVVRKALKIVLFLLQLHLRLGGHSNSRRFPRFIVNFRSAQCYAENVLMISVFVLIIRKKFYLHFLFSFFFFEKRNSHPQGKHVGLNFLVHHLTVRLDNLLQSLIDILGHCAIATNVKVTPTMDQHVVDLRRLRLNTILNVGLERKMVIRLKLLYLFNY